MTRRASAIVVAVIGPRRDRLRPDNLDRGRAERAIRNAYAERSSAMRAHGQHTDPAIFHPR